MDRDESRWLKALSFLGLVLLVGAIISLVLLLADCYPKPAPPPKTPPTFVIPPCPADVGTQLRVQGEAYSTADCYNCERAFGCFTAGNTYCCRDEMCSECGESIFGAVRDAGAP